jgi:hypothetical protein
MNTSGRLPMMQSDIRQLSKMEFGSAVRLRSPLFSADEQAFPGVRKGENKKAKIAKCRNSKMDRPRRRRRRALARPPLSELLLAAGTLHVPLLGRVTHYMYLQS